METTKDGHFVGGQMATGCLTRPANSCCLTPVTTVNVRSDLRRLLYFAVLNGHYSTTALLIKVFPGGTDQNIFGTMHIG
jgi:hypothetical protein